MKVSYVQELTYATEHAAIVFSLFESYFPSEFPPDDPATKVELFSFSNPNSIVVLRKKN